MKQKPFPFQNALLLLAVFIAGSGSVLAQPRTPLPRSADSIKEASVSVYQSYQPELRPVTKPIFLPSGPPADTQTVGQQYPTEVAPAVVPYYPVPLRPIALERDAVGGPGLDYLKTGGGNLGSFLLEGATAQLSTTDIQSVLFVKHRGWAKGEISAQRKQATDIAWNFGGNARALGRWGAFTEVQRRSYGQYGFNEGAAQKSDGTNVYFGAAAGVSLRTDTGSFLGGAEPRVEVRFFNGPQIGTEKTALFTLPARYAVAEGFTLEGAFHAGLTSVSRRGSSSYNNSYAQLPLALNYKQERLWLTVGVVPTLDRKRDLFILPDLKIRYALSPQRFWVEGGFKGNLLQNRLETLSAENPFLNSYAPVQTRSRELWAELGANMGKYVTATFRVSDTRFKNLLLYTNDLQVIPGRGFQLLSVPEAGAFSVRGSLRYLVGKSFALEATGALYSYRSDDVSTFWHLPASRVGLNFYWQALEKVSVHSSLATAGGLEARGPFGNPVDLASVIDLSAGAEWTFYKNWSLGLDVYNVLNRRNERYWGYPAFGFNVLGSLQVRF